MSAYHKISVSDLKEMESRPRAELVNTLSGFKSPVLVGSVNGEGVHNLSIVSSLMHLGSSPALMGIVLRPPGEYAHTFKNIKATGQFTISHVPSNIVKQAHRCSAKFPEHISEFDAVGLTPNIYNANNWKAPAVDESYIRFGLVLNKIIELPNKCNLVIGEVDWIEINPRVIDQDRLKFDLNDICILGVYEYYKASPHMRLAYEEYPH